MQTLYTAMCPYTRNHALMYSYIRQCALVYGIGALYPASGLILPLYSAVGALLAFLYYCTHCTAVLYGTVLPWYPAYTAVGVVVAFVMPWNGYVFLHCSRYRTTVFYYAGGIRSITLFYVYCSRDGATPRKIQEA